MSITKKELHIFSVIDTSCSLSRQAELARVIINSHKFAMKTRMFNIYVRPSEYEVEKSLV